MSRKSAVAVLVACCAVLPATAWAASEADCAVQWKSADGNDDSVLMGPEADRYLAYYRFTSVSSLAKDGDGVWRSSAMKDGKSVKIAVDFKGNVVSE